MKLLNKHASAPVHLYQNSPQMRDGKFSNARPRSKTSSSNILRLMWNYYFNKPKDCEPSEPVPVIPITRSQLDKAPDFSLFRLGHSTVLLKIGGQFWLTDPVFSNRASPFSFMGPKRFHAPPIDLNELPPLAAVILSHNHYDHLDRKAILALNEKAERFITPLGVGDILIRWGISASKIDQFDWWQSTQIGPLQCVATPAQHFSGRSLRDSNKTLWCSWVLIAEDLRIYFSGDSGYFDGFKEIGERYGPFDVTLMETGAYNHQWTYVHMTPEESLQAHIDVGGRWLLPIHNGTFDLAMHAWYDPFERIDRLAQQRQIALTTPQMGELLLLKQPHPGKRWWRDLMRSHQISSSQKSLATET